MRAFDFDPDHARRLTTELFDAAAARPHTPTLPVEDPSPALDRFTGALSRALGGVDTQTRLVHEQAHRLADAASQAIGAAVDTDADLARRLTP
ncbi:hypothetical protein CATRI_02640 [Corynebacterium atrinae]|uniref:hypothetical protein n=1 Tax=Corynebacterium atrinae TaxID=1336740 RepID=UPI0025B43EE3|nr:hypothetical protein [Corynebacterium atrinae]WJY62633.1 hypothetical protein CATRI_02640 [Corynebacterium atrinae]